MQQVAGNIGLINPLVFNHFGYGTYAQVIKRKQYSSLGYRAQRSSSLVLDKIQQVVFLFSRWFHIKIQCKMQLEMESCFVTIFCIRLGSTKVFQLNLFEECNEEGESEYSFINIQIRGERREAGFLQILSIFPALEMKSKEIKMS